MAAEITGKIYNYFFKTGSGFAITVLLGAMVYERTVQIACEHIWETRNQGVSHSNQIIF